MDISEIIDEHLTYFGIDIPSKKDVIKFAVNALYEQQYIDDVEAFTAAVYEREKIGVTGIGDGIAIPHGKSDAVKKPGVVILKLKNEIAWESLDDQKIKIIFLFAIGNNMDSDMNHLKMLASFAAKLGNEEKIEKILQAGDSYELLENLRR